MGLVLSVHFRQNYYEYFLSGENNRVIDEIIPASVSGFMRNISLKLEVWEGEWRLRDSADVDVGETVILRGGLRVDCRARFNRERFTAVVEDVPATYSLFEKYRIGSGRITIGREADNQICFDTQKLVSGHHAILEANADGGVTIVDQSQNGTFVNGKRFSGLYHLRFGDVIGIFGLKIVYLGDVIAVNRPNNDCVMRGLTPYDAVDAEPAAPSLSADDADTFYKRAPRLLEQLDTETIQVEAPLSQNKSLRQPLYYPIEPALTIGMPLALCVLFMMLMAGQSGMQTSVFVFVGVIMLSTAAAIGAFWMLTNTRKRRRREADETQVQQHLAHIRAALQQKDMVNKGILDRLYPHVRDCLAMMHGNSPRLWERNVNHSDFLSVRLGLGQIPSPNPIQMPDGKPAAADATWADEAQAICDAHKQLRDVPVCLSLREHTLVGVIADSREATDNLARMIAIQLAAYHAYSDLRMVFLYHKDSAERYAFARWLPHVWSEDGEVRLLADDAAGVGEVLYKLSAVIRGRMQDEDGGRLNAYGAWPNTGERRDGAAKLSLPHYVVFITDPRLIEGEAFAKYLYAPSVGIGLSVVLLYGEISLLPNACTVLIRQDKGFSGYCSLDNAFADCGGVDFDLLSSAEAERFSRELSGIRVRETQAAGAIPAMLSFLDMYRVSDVRALDVYRNWLENRSFESLKAMVGYRSSESPLYVDIHEKYHGPHGLVAGMTGSGKSELLQTYILSLALNYDPREVSFILIDYKGGGMTKGLEGLIHVAGIITNLGGNQTIRALASIHSEITRRQILFNEYGVKHIDAYIELFRADKVAKPMPHLIIIVDEFAELKKEQPIFISELISAARVGRSLGIHLILATQDPGASVDDEIWSNTSFRICLRVAGKHNSLTVLRRPDAAYITNAGRGYYQVGNDEIFDQFQSGWSGDVYASETPYNERGQNEAEMINLWGKTAVNTGKKMRKPNSDSITHLQAVVGIIEEIAEEKQIAAIDDIWLPPLPERVILDDLAGQTKAGNCLQVVLGLADYPTGQRQFAFCYDFLEQGHLMIAGSSGSGKTALLQTILFNLVCGYTPTQAQFYIADFNSRTLGVFMKAPHCGGVVYDGDQDKIDKLMTMLSRELKQRIERFSEKGIGSFKEYIRLYDDVPAIVLVVDHFAAFAENKDKLQDDLIHLIRQSASYGMYLVLTCASAGDVRGRIRQHIGSGIGLQLSDRYAYEDVLGARLSILPDERVTGRGLALCVVGGDRSEALEVQFALALDANDGASLHAGLRRRFEEMTIGGETATRIPQIPDDMRIETLLAIPEIAQKCASGRYLPLGYDMAEAVPIYADLTNTFCFSISGSPGSGKTTLLKAMIAISKRQGFSTWLYDAPSRDLEGFAQESSAAYMSSAAELYGFIEKVLAPAFLLRNPGKDGYLDGGCADPDAYFASEHKICLFIHNMAAFCEAVYHSEKDMQHFIETILLPKGRYHMLYLFACISPDDFAGEWGWQPVLRKFTGFREGLHLGGSTDGQRIFSFEIPILQRGQKLPAGQGHILDGGTTKRIAVVTL